MDVHIKASYVICQETTFENIFTIWLLIEGGADFNLCNEHGITPLHEAANRGHIRVVELLIDRDRERAWEERWRALGQRDISCLCPHRRRRQRRRRWWREESGSPSTFASEHSKSSSSQTVARSHARSRAVAVAALPQSQLSAYERRHKKEV